MTTTPKETIQEILTKLDITDDANWTEDGAPALDIVQKMADDETITRDDINAAEPGFVRQIGDKKAPKTPRAPSTKAQSNIVDRKFTDDEMREILDRRIVDAENSLIAARKAQSEANMEVANCEKRLARAHVDHSRQFPPITPSANIKAHLASQGREAAKRAGLDPDKVVMHSPIDEVMGRNTRRGTGQNRPTRPVMNGRIVTAA